VTHSTLSGEEATLAALETAGLQIEVRARVRAPLGGIVGAREQELRRLGVLSGPAEEEVLVVAGRRPGGACPG
jgi:hypothetical protein